MPPKRKGGKLKAARPPVIDGANALHLKAALDSGQKLDESMVLTLLHADQPCEGLYSKNCKTKATNPNCLCNLIPAPDGHRKTGLWAKGASNKVSVLLGPDPTNLRREKQDQPVGLRNLGNTCYVNSVLQCLFAVPAFRDAVFSAPPSLLDDPVIGALRELFARMLVGASNPVDPQPLMSALQLDHTVQQDGQEFMKLFLTLLESRFADHAVLRGTIQGLLRGRAGYETVCLDCGKPSESSLREDSFYELDVPVRGYTSLNESLSSLLGAEILCGDNQYFCERCGGKRDARRQLRVRALPPLLCLSLQRFVFDMVKLDRIKATDKLSFPLVLPASALMGTVFNDGQSDASTLYDLQAILIHKGGSALHGHYVAHIKLDGAANGNGSTWWRFDDESVSEMKKGPLGSADHGAGTSTPQAATHKAENPKKGSNKGGGATRGGDKAVSKRGRGGGGGKRGGRKKAKQTKGGWSAQVDEDGNGVLIGDDSEIDLVGDSDAEHEENVSFASTGTKDTSNITSSNAYLLLYRRRGVDLTGPQLKPEAQAWLDNAKERFQREFNESCTAHTAATREAEEQVSSRRVEVRQLIESAAVMPPDDPGRFVSASWLQSWADAEPSSTPGPIDNAPLLCQHGKLDPGRYQAMRRLPTHAWGALVSMCQGGPELGPADACPTCLSQLLAQVADTEDSQESRERYLAIAATILADEASKTSEIEEESGWEELDGVEAPSPAYYVAKSWLMAWQRREGKTMGTTPPTTAIRCPHGGLAPENLTKTSKRIAIPPDFWAYLQRSWELAQAERERKEQMRRIEASRKSQGGAAVFINMPAVATRDDVVVLDAVDPQDSAKIGQGAAKQPDNDTRAKDVHQSAASTNANVVIVEETKFIEDTTTANGIAQDIDSLLSNDPFPVGAPECEVCVWKLNAAAKMNQGLRSRREAERSDLAHLLTPALLQLIPDVESYRFVPRIFMDQWRAYMAQTGGRRAPALVGQVNPTKPSVDVVQPPNLAECIAGALCECHHSDPSDDPSSANRGPRLAYPPPKVLNRRGRWMLAESDDDTHFEVVSAKDWESFVTHYVEVLGAPLGEQGIRATLIVGPEGVGTSTVTGQENADEVKMEENDITGKPEMEGDTDKDAEIGEQKVMVKLDTEEGNLPTDVLMSSRGAVGLSARLETDPPLCMDTIAARETARRSAKLTYTGAEVMVQTAPTDDEAIVGEGAGGVDAGERKSKRARKGRAPIIVDSTMTLFDLRLRIFQGVGVHPRNARLFVRGSVLESPDTASLAECEIFPGEEIRVVDTGAHDADDLTGLFPPGPGGGKSLGQRGPEGFGGTALAGLGPVVLDAETRNDS